MCLYWDQAVPKGVLLQWTLQLLFGVKVAPSQLRQLVENCLGLRVELYLRAPLRTSKRLAFQALLKEPPDGCPGFVSEDNVGVAKQSVTDGVWQELLRVVTLGGWAKATDVAHKFFVVANHLQQVSPVLRSLGFGRLLSLVRAADKEGDVIGHRNGLLVPYHESDEFERFQNASAGMPTHVQPDESYVRTWDELRLGLSKLLLAGNGVLEVSRLKHHFRMELGVELSETVFGHQTLSTLLSDCEIAKEFLLEERTLRRRLEPEICRRCALEVGR